MRLHSRNWTFRSLIACSLIIGMTTVDKVAANMRGDGFVGVENCEYVTMTDGYLDQYVESLFTNFHKKLSGNRFSRCHLCKISRTIEKGKEFDSLIEVWKTLKKIRSLTSNITRDNHLANRKTDALQDELMFWFIRGRRSVIMQNDWNSKSSTISLSLTMDKSPYHYKQCSEVVQMQQERLNEEITNATVSLWTKHVLAILFGYLAKELMFLVYSKRYTVDGCQLTTSADSDSQVSVVRTLKLNYESLDRGDISISVDDNPDYANYSLSAAAGTGAEASEKASAPQADSSGQSVSSVLIADLEDNEEHRKKYFQKISIMNQHKEEGQ